jgi:hypothetical protein
VIPALAVGIAACLLLLVGPRISEGRARRKQADATDTQQATDFWDALEAFHIRLDDNPEANAVDHHYAAVQAARRATRISDMPHQANRGRAL